MRQKRPQLRSSPSRGSGPASVVRYGILLCASAITAYPSSATAQSQADSSAAAPPANAGTQEITVTARRRGTRSAIDRTIFDIDAGDDAASLNTTDVLRRLPGVTVTASSNVTVRGGANVGFLVDGKPVRRELALAIPASQIDRVELITTPPAEYASDDEALLNIILKKAAGVGWSGSGSGKVDTQGGYRAGASIVRGDGPTSGSGSLTLRSIPGIVDSVRDTSFIGASTSSDQRVRTRERSTFRQLSGQAKVTHRLAENESLEVVAGASYNVNPHDDAVVEMNDGSAGPRQLAYRRGIGFSGFYPSGSVTYRNRSSEDYGITVGIDANGGRSDERRDFTGDVTQRLADRLSFHFAQLSVDYDTRMDDDLKIMVGALIAVNGVRDNLLLSGFRGVGQDQTVNFGFHRKSFAAYVTGEGEIAGFGVKPGLRLEGFTQDITLAQRAAAGFEGTVRLLPSLHLTRKVGDGQSIKLSFSVRLEKPDALNFNPSLKFNSTVQADQGNPFLRPIRKVQGEINYTIEKKILFIENSVYARKSINEVNNVQYLTDNNVTVTSFVNLGYSETFGYSLNARIKPSSKLEIGAGIDLFHQKIVAPAALALLGSATFLALNGNVTVTYAPDKQNSFLSTIGYTSRNETLGLVNPATATTDFQYSRALSNKLSLTVNLIDFGAPQTLTTRFRGPGISGVERVRRASRLVRVGLSKTF